MPSAHRDRDRPVVVLLHGSRLSGAAWDGYAARLPGVEVLAPDLPGHGSRWREEFTWQGAVDTAAAAVRRAGARPVVLVGHSLGGYVALGYASSCPGTLTALVLVGATGEPRGAGAALYRGFARAALAAGPRRTGRLTSAVMRRLGAPPALAAQLSDGTGYRTLPTVWEAVMAHARPELLARVDCPVVLVNGQFDQMRLHQRRFVAHAPRAGVVTVRKATHLLPLTHPDQLAAVLREVTRRAGRLTGG